MINDIYVCVCVCVCVCVYVCIYNPMYIQIFTKSDSKLVDFVWSSHEVGEMSA